MKTLHIATLCALLAATVPAFAQSGGSGVPGSQTTTTGVPGSRTTTTGVPGSQTTTTGVPGSNTTTSEPNKLNNVAPSAGVTNGGTLPAGALSFQSLDANKDGRLTRQELDAQGLSDSLFFQMDTNHDGFVDEVEMNAHGPVMKPTMR